MVGEERDERMMGEGLGKIDGEKEEGEGERLGKRGWGGEEEGEGEEERRKVRRREEGGEVLERRGW